MTRELSETDIFVLLAERRRRLALRVLHRSAGPLTIAELAERIGRRERETPTPSDVHVVYLALYHQHLPKFEEADVVRYDRDEGSVYPDRNFDELVRVLERVDERGESWSSD